MPGERCTAVPVRSLTGVSGAGSPGRAARRWSSSVSAASPRASTASASARLRGSSSATRSSTVPSVTMPVHLHRPGLADPVGAVGGLLLDGGVPPAVEVDHVVGAGEVEPGAAGLERQQEDRRPALRPAWKRRHHRLALRGPACRRAGTGGRCPARVRWASSRRPIATYWVKTRAAPPSAEHGAEQLVEQVELLRPAREPDRAGLLQEVGRVVADLLQAGQQRQHQPAAGASVVGALDARHGVAARTTRRARPARGSGAAGGRSRSWPGSSGAMPGSDLRRRSRNGPIRSGELPRPCVGLEPGLDRRGPDLAEGLPAAEQPGARPVEDRPQLGEVVLDGGAGQGDAGRPGDRAQRPGGGGARRS